MTYSSCLTDSDSTLALDSSVVINLLATQRARHILRALSRPILIADNVVREIDQGGANGRAEVDMLRQMIADETVQMIELSGQALTCFFSLVAGSAAESLGDGEAATLAVAYTQHASAAIDEKKATRISAARYPAVRLATTFDILVHDTVRSAIGQDALAEAVFQALKEARMQVREHQFERVLGLIGHDNVMSCTSLRRLAKRVCARNSE